MAVLLFFLEAVRCLSWTGMGSRETWSVTVTSLVATMTTGILCSLLFADQVNGNYLSFLEAVRCSSWRMFGTLETWSVTTDYTGSHRLLQGHQNDDVMLILSDHLKSGWNSYFITVLVQAKEFEVLTGSTHSDKFWISLTQLNLDMFDLGLVFF